MFFFKKIFWFGCVLLSSSTTETWKSFPWFAQARSSARLLCLRASLTPGSHVLRLRFARALPPSATEPRRLALMLNDIHLEPLPATDTRKEPLEQDRVS